MQKKQTEDKAPSSRLLKWYDRHRRVLPWRAEKGVTPNPYHVWLSEIMLQQTTVQTVGPYFAKFLEKWPRVEDLAEANAEDIRRLWAGLGYYRRAHNLHLAAKAVVENRAGLFPVDEQELLSLPGLGPYTAAAVRAIAFDERANVVDGNVERVVARFFVEKTPLPKGKAKIRALAETLLPSRRYGDYAQALMDLGSSVCTPRAPRCDLCPLAEDCRAKAQNNAETLPRREEVKAKPLRRAAAFVITKGDKIWLRQRPPTGLLAQMTEVPSSAWEEGDFPSLSVALRQAGLPKETKVVRPNGFVRHVFTHFVLEVEVYAVCAKSAPKGAGQKEGRWTGIGALDAEALPSLMRKIIRHAIMQGNRLVGGRAP